jgi:fructose-bisphosphate aldolase class 1
MCAFECERPANTDTASLYVNSIVSLLNRYAQIAQENGLVPIVEPEVIKCTQ